MNFYATIGNITAGLLTDMRVLILTAALVFFIHHNHRHIMNLSF